MNTFVTIIRLTFASLSLLVCIAGGRVSAENWPRFRGPGGSGISESTEIPSQWTDENHRWVAELPGGGNSSPVIWQDKVFITAADEKLGKRWLICLNQADGNERWRAESAFTKYKTHKNNSFASSTPAVDDQHVYQLWHSKEATSLIAYDHDGQEVWRYELGPYSHGQGGATSPIVAGGLVVVAHDHQKNSFLVAVDRMTGQTRWKIPRQGKRACYSTPCLRSTAEGQHELVFVHCYEGVIGVELETGKQNWHVDPFGREPQRALASPIIAGDLVIAGSGAVAGDRQIVAIAIERDQGKVTANQKYKIIRQAPHVPSPLAIGNRFYLWNDGGIVTCCEADTGEVIWQKRVGGSYFASPIAVGNRIFSIDTSGEVVVIAADDTFRIIAKNSMGEGSRASLAASDNVLYVRTNSKLFAIESK